MIIFFRKRVFMIFIDEFKEGDFINGIYLFADTRNKKSLLAGVIDCPPQASEEKMKETLLNWLYYDFYGALKEKKKASLSKTPYPAFGAKLNAAMTLAELSNLRLGQLIHVDSSVISRFRNGIRTFSFSSSQGSPPRTESP